MRFPISLWMEVEGRCNLACRFCYNFWRDGSEATPRALTTAELLAGLTSLLEQFDCHQVAISGGEPLLRVDLEDIVRFLKRQKLPVILTTNGTLLTAEKADALRDWGVDTVQVSLHSPRADEHDWLAVGPAFRPAVLALMLLRERCVNVAAAFVATQRNLSRFPEMLRLLGRIDVRAVIFNRFIVSGLGVRHHDELGVPDDRRVLQVLREAGAIAAANGQTIFMGTPVMSDDEGPAELASIRFASCPVRAKQSRWTIGVDGELRRCNHSSLSIGNILGNGISELARTFVEKEASVSEGSSCNQCQLNTEYFRQRTATQGVESVAL